MFYLTGCIISGIVFYSLFIHNKDAEDRTFRAFVLAILTSWVGLGIFITNEVLLYFVNKDEKK
jgi:hypothetical protein